MAETSVYSEVRKVIADKISRQEVIVVDWLTHEIVGTKTEIEGADVDFYKVCAFTHVKDVVKRCVGKYDSKPKREEDILLPGFEHLQVAYSVVRNGEIVLVPVDLLTDEEIDARAAEYDQMAKSCRAHAMELRKFKRTRRAAA